MPFTHIALTLALFPGSLPAPPPDGLADRLLTLKDLPTGYRPAPHNPFGFGIDALFDPVHNAGDRCRLPIETPARDTEPRRSVSAVFQNDAEDTLSTESVTEVLSAPGAKDATAIVGTAAALPGRCPSFETPGFTVYLKPLPLPRIGDASAAFQANLNQKAIGSEHSYIDSYIADVAVVAKGDVSVTVVVFGFFTEHEISLAEVTRRAVELAG
ncbi:hypothetical protein Ait01nite_077910 [Actinoplanes italicus]|uniref:PknH-like protein n=1 Tax=Actinoplanes italicus TaxID=113567 RepID=A0A2T0K4I4_9ACTN|nr:hypothetical protein [Actinoplanes italicus]PRX17569.1 hypothetical protein CLV67_11561 [Actinoplanes italicus]GIE34746.1 hypothetical protein Ait01nite_077910 [Actinoplanes italicus]